MDEIHYLEKGHVYLIHKNTIETYGGWPGVYDNTDGKIESILAQQFPIFGKDKYPSVFQKAAMLLYFFTKDHCFRDGNKRVGMLSAYTLLGLNGYSSIMDDLEGYDLTISVSASQISENERDEYIDYIAGWLMENYIATEEALT